MNLNETAEFVAFSFKTANHAMSENLQSAHNPGTFVRALRHNAIHPRARPIAESFGYIARHGSSAEFQCGGYLNRATSRTGARLRAEW